MIELLNENKGMEKMRKLDLSHNIDYDDDLWLFYHDSFPHLQEINLQGTGISAETLRLLAIDFRKSKLKVKVNIPEEAYESSELENLEVINTDPNP